MMRVPMQVVRVQRRQLTGCLSTTLDVVLGGSFRGVHTREEYEDLVKKEGLPLPSREDLVQRMKDTEEFDVLVVGAGSTGAGAALDAASRGLNVACVEREDYSSQTSARSTKLIWAGIRYIGTAVAALFRKETLSNPVGAWGDFVGEFKLVLAAHRERKLMLQNQPHLVKWVPIAAPVDRWFMWPPPMGHWMFSIAPVVFPFLFKFYDGLSKFTCPPSYIMGTKTSAKYFPQITSKLKYVQVFYEGQHNDARTGICIALTAAQHGAAIANHTEVIDFLREDIHKPGRVTGAIVRDRISGEEFPIRAKSVILAGGPFTDELRKVEDPLAKPAVRGAAGTHIVLPGYFSPRAPKRMGLLDINTSDSRFLFFLPWLGHTVVGTTDRPAVPTSSPEPPESEIRWILDEVKKYMTDDVRVRRSDVLSAWCGFRPLAEDPHHHSGAASRDHVVSVNPQTGVVFVTGGKWTTYREMASDAVDRAIAKHKLEPKGECKTQDIKLLGALGYTSTQKICLIQRYGISDEAADHLVGTYGGRAWDVCAATKPTGRAWPKFGRSIVENYPYLESEVQIAVEEHARTVVDVIAYRTRLAYLNVEAAEAAIPKVTELMAELLGWDEEEATRQSTYALEYLSKFGGPVPKEGNLLHSQLEDARAVFAALDEDETGYLDAQNIKNAFKTLNLPGNVEEVMARLEIVDDGRIEWDEFKAWWDAADMDDPLYTELSRRVETP